ncbi:MAG: Flagellar basal-body rod protein FlgG [Syntrophomonadaceae bacterium]|nr:Flagellar basal-body rod protein FlgG [Bacillota bacterium]
MIRGLYTAASGMMVESARQETITNNLANSETTGFKRDLALQRAQAELPVLRVGDSNHLPLQPVIGTLGTGSLVAGIHTVHEQGVLRETGRKLDLSLAGAGFFTVETAQGVRFTRNGAFTLDADGFLLTDAGHRVMGTEGYLQIPAGEMTVNDDGRLFVDGAPVGQLRLALFAEQELLSKQGESLFDAGGQVALPAAAQVKQGFLESANIQVIQEIVRMIATQRAYETNQRALQAQDELLGKAVNEIGSLR